MERATCEKRGTVAQEIQEITGAISSRIDELQNRISGQLSPIVISAAPEPCGNTPIAQGREYPPYFEDLRVKLNSIDRSIDAIFNVLDRTEI